MKIRIPKGTIGLIGGIGWVRGGEIVASWAELERHRRPPDRQPKTERRKRKAPT